MCFLLILTFALIVSFIIVYVITKPVVEGYERCLCSPLGEQVPGSYVGGISQADRNYVGYSTYPNAVNEVLNAPVLYTNNMPVVMSQADRMYMYNDTNVNQPQKQVTFAQFPVSYIPSQADRGYMNQSFPSYDVASTVVSATTSNPTCV